MSETLTPVFRLEYFITAAANSTPCDLEPIFNEEKYLHAIAGADVDLPMPIGRTQEYLAKLAGMDVEIPDHPVFRTEYYLAHMIDNTVECPAPIFREEMFYYEWASNEYVTISGNPVSFTAKAAPLRQLKVAFSPVQSGTGDPSPDNVRPISGWDSLNVEQRGKNLLDWQTKIKDYMPITGLHFVPIDLPRNTTLTYSDDYGQWHNVANGYLHLTTASNNTEFSAGAWRVELINRDAPDRQKFTFTTPDTDEQLYLRFYQNLNVFDYCTWMQIEVGSDNTAYEEYNPSSRSISISLGQTVYSGWVDVVTGVVTVDMAMYTATDDGEWRFDVAGGSYNYVYYRAITMGTDAAKMVCNIAPTVNNMSALGVTRSGGGFIQLYCNDIGIESLADWRTYIRNNTVQFVYPLATPTTIQLTPQEVESLLGDNVLFSDANGDLTVEYRSN